MSEKNKKDADQGAHDRAMIMLEIYRNLGEKDRAEMLAEVRRLVADR